MFQTSVNINFGNDDASLATIKEAYNSDEKIRAKIDIMLIYMNRNPNMKMTLTGNTDASPSNYKSNNRNNSKTRGNGALSWDRANNLKSFILELSSSARSSLEDSVIVVGAGETNANGNSGQQYRNVQVTYK